MMDDLEPGGLILLFGVEVQPLSEQDSFTTSTATEAIIESLPRSISFAGNLGTITAVWAVTPEMLAELTAPEETTDDGLYPDHDRNAKVTEAEEHAEAVGPSGEAQS